MKALTLWQPWATLIDIGAKLYETRSWKPKLWPGHLLAIHAGKRIAEDALWNGAMNEAMREYWRECGSELSQGKVLCVVRFRGAFQTERIDEDDPDWAAMDEGARTFEMGLGDFSPGRYAWKFDLVCRFWPGIPARGAQKLWEFDLEGALREMGTRNGTGTSFERRSNLRTPVLPEDGPGGDCCET